MGLAPYAVKQGSARLGQNLSCVSAPNLHHRSPGVKAYTSCNSMRRFRSKSRSKTASLEKLRAAQIILDDTLNVDSSEYAQIWAKYIIAQRKMKQQPRISRGPRGPSPYLPGWESAPGQAVANSGPQLNNYKKQDPGDDGRPPW